MDVALLGGSFNPPHVGHLLAAHYVRAVCPVDEVWLVPSFRHPFGKALAPFEHRVSMCQLLETDTAGWLKTCRVEEELKGTGWTIEAVRLLRKQHPSVSFSLVLGSDLMADFGKWKEADELRRMVKLIVLSRAGHPHPEAAGPVFPEVSSSDVRQRLAAGELPAALVPRTVLQYVREHHLYVRSEA